MEISHVRVDRVEICRIVISRWCANNWKPIIAHRVLRNVMKHLRTIEVIPSWPSFAYTVLKHTFWSIIVKNSLRNTRLIFTQIAPCCIMFSSLLLVLSIGMSLLPMIRVEIFPDISIVDWCVAVSFHREVNLNCKRIKPSIYVQGLPWYVMWPADDQGP